ncbi:hypothetical protein IHE61_13540 [Streptomyces sp. GKU 257-1]|nr:hypothetical protein [Streptomyces sp. GKU 257-1]
MAVYRAKTWLESTMRVGQAYSNTDNKAWAKKLTLQWPYGGNRPFSYDLGGIFRGGEWDGEQFCAEVKWRKNASDQGSEYRSYLAKCYVALSEGYMLGDHFLWITWAPFRASDWDQLTSTEEILKAVLAERGRALGTEDEEEARTLLKQDVVQELTGRLWPPLIMCEQQENLVPLEEWRAVVAAHLQKRREGPAW